MHERLVKHGGRGTPAANGWHDHQWLVNEQCNEHLPLWPPANDDVALLPLLVQLLSRALVHVQEENLRQAGDDDAAGFICDRQRLAR